MNIRALLLAKLLGLGKCFGFFGRHVAVVSEVHKSLFCKVCISTLRPVWSLD
jgi:hypothetical protein